MAEAELAEADLLAARQHGGAAVAAATRLGMKYHLMCALLASARVAAAAGDLGRAHDDAYRGSSPVSASGSAHAGEIRRIKEQPDRVKPRFAIVAVACGGLYRWRGDEIRARVTSSLAARDDSPRRSSGGARCDTRARETARWS